MDRVLILGDLHCPWIHKPSLQYLFKTIIPQIKPTIVVQIGDIFDLYSFSKFPRSHNVISPDLELTMARECAENIWKATRKALPKAKLYQILGNHDVRAKLRLFEKCPELESLINIKDLFKFEGVTTVHDTREELYLEVNGETICFMHGFRSKLGDHTRYNQISTVTGHSHRGGVVFHPVFYPRTKIHKTLFELNAGYLGDPSSKVMSYTSQKISNWTHGVGVIDEHGPRFVPF